MQRKTNTKPQAISSAGVPKPAAVSSYSSIKSNTDVAASELEQRVKVSPPPPFASDRWAAGGASSSDDEEDTKKTNNKKAAANKAVPTRKSGKAKGKDRYLVAPPAEADQEFMPAGGAPDPFADNDALPPSSFDPFADARADDAVAGAGVDDACVHLRVQQRNGKKTLTTVQGLSASYNYAKVLRDLKRELCCNGTVVEDKELGNVIQLQGDHRKRVAGFLAKAGLAKTECIKVHGF
uniref:Protein translation factor SUI1 homolog n=1 Tax=Triticum urartu TaxID=4572 RepID=A0A8R7TMQ5_TRIUA